MDEKYTPYIYKGTKIDRVEPKHRGTPATKKGLSTTWTFVAPCPVFYYAFLCGKSRVSDLLGYILLDFRCSKPTSKDKPDVYLQA